MRQQLATIVCSRWIFNLASKSIQLTFKTSQVQKCEGTDTVVTGSTGGDLMVWRAAEGQLASLAKLRVHQSGVNCLQVGIQNTSKNEVTLRSQVKAAAVEGENLILSGGDDCMVALSRLVIEKKGGGEVEKFEKLWDTTSSNWSHTAQVSTQPLPLLSLSSRHHCFSHKIFGGFSPK